MILLDISRYKCPSCDEVVGVDQIQDFSTRFAKRNPFDCPHCLVKLNWEKTSHHLAHYSMWIAFLSFPMPFLGLISFGAAIWILFFFTGLSGLGMMIKRLDFHSKKEKYLLR